MKQKIGFGLGILSIAWMFLSGLIYWSSVYGGIGFFGALLTTPISTILFLILRLFWGWSYFLGTVVWVGLTLWLLIDEKL